MLNNHPACTLGRTLLLAGAALALAPVALAAGTPPRTLASPEGREQIAIRSTEKGSTVFAGGRPVGTLPCRWDDRDVTGTVTVRAERRGGPARTLTLSYSGGRITKVVAVPPLDATPEPTATPGPTAAATASVYFATLPPIADIYLDGTMIGKSNVATLTLPAGTLSLRFVKGPREVTRQFTLQPGMNPSLLVRLP